MAKAKAAMADKRVYTEKHRRDSYRVMLAPGTLLWGGFKKKWQADGIVETLNVVLDAIERDARADERERCASLVVAMSGDIPQARWIAEQIRRSPA